MKNNAALRVQVGHIEWPLWAKSVFVLHVKVLRSGYAQQKADKHAVVQH